MSFAGIDRLAYPGDEFMAGLMQNSNLLWTGFYLTPAPNQRNRSWMDRLSTLRSQGPGWGIAPLFVGQQNPSTATADFTPSSIRTAEQGRVDAEAAMNRADEAGFASEAELELPGAARIYLDIELGGHQPREDRTYIKAWCATITQSDKPYLPGVYCSFKDAAAELKADNPGAVFWVFNINQFLHHHDQAMTDPDTFLKPDITQSGFAGATAWQWIQQFASITTTLPDGTRKSLRTWDLDVSTVPDPSHPDRTFDVDAGVWLD